MSDDSSEFWEVWKPRSRGHMIWASKNEWQFPGLRQWVWKWGWSGGTVAGELHGFLGGFLWLVGLQQRAGSEGLILGVLGSLLRRWDLNLIGTGFQLRCISSHNHLVRISWMLKLMWNHSCHWWPTPISSFGVQQDSFTVLPDYFKYSFKSKCLSKLILMKGYFYLFFLGSLHKITFWIKSCRQP